MSSDTRFSRLKTDPRFRRPKKQSTKVVVDQRFKSIFEGDKKGKGKDKGAGKGKGSGKASVDKYGRKISANHDRDNLRRFYQLEDDEAEGEEGGSSRAPDYARGEVLLESSDEGSSDSESDAGEVTLGRDVHKEPESRRKEADDELEIDLDESNFADLDAQAEAYAKESAKTAAEAESSRGAETSRIAVVNLDWDHIRSEHLFKIFSSVVASASGKKGRVLNVRVYPSEFGKERMAREEKEGPPPEVFKKSRRGDIDEEEEEEDINEKTIFNEDGGEEYNEDALRQYQLERLRYYYAIVTCDSVATAAHAYSELEGTELERSANVFDLSYVPEDMEFGDDFRDEATTDAAVFKGVDFVTDALRHSKVKLTWDDDDPNRVQFTRRTLTRKQIEEDDFRAYIASSESEDEEEEGNAGRKAARRDKLRSLLLEDDNLPEGWGGKEDKGGDMEITFTPGLSESSNKKSSAGGGEGDGDKDETTLERYARKQREKRAKKKAAKQDGEETKKPKKVDDEFFGDDSGGDDESNDEVPSKPQKGKKDKKDQKSRQTTPPPAATKEELALLAVPDGPGDSEPRHFDMRAVLKAEKAAKLKGKKHHKRKGKRADDDNDEKEDGSGFQINVKDDRFRALHEDHQFAIDPSNPQFKATKSMAALLSERSKRRKEKDWAAEAERNDRARATSESGDAQDIKRLVESVKRKSKNKDGQAMGKRRKVAS
ncbi:hypothetical protein BOTBODRAFT_134036 [Botryobasidium botryosum FD-172 SS1]|uniref:Uncharacterized protein n=1 Tax=Botryobasidium botryosum (strain FD-172 SS1) TaxID=930990 RepID=A0A067MMS6_BOTB1|nr:hypothetical protein BOTBODRAFT_134036 [Botryobasidium botryosum FD-172 SS1]